MSTKQMLSSRYFLLVLTGCYRNLENPDRHHLTLKKLKLVVQTAKSMSAERNPNVFVNGQLAFFFFFFSAFNANISLSATSLATFSFFS
jgi:hypothetical protein